MIIRMDEKGTEAFFAEGYHIACQYRKLKENPTRALRNTFRNTGIYSIVCLGLGVGLLGLGLLLVQLFLMNYTLFTC